jgi:hypothetical protein
VGAKGAKEIEEVTTKTLHHRDRSAAWPQPKPVLLLMNADLTLKNQLYH